MFRQSVLQVQVALAGLPINLICLSNGQSVLVKTENFNHIHCLSDDNLIVDLWTDGLQLQKYNNTEEYSYGVMYNHQRCTLLTEWLRQLKLQNPFTGEF